MWYFKRGDVFRYCFEVCLEIRIFIRDGSWKKFIEVFLKVVFGEGIFVYEGKTEICLVDSVF